MNVRSEASPISVRQRDLKCYIFVFANFYLSASFCNLSIDTLCKTEAFGNQTVWSCQQDKSFYIFLFSCNV